MDDGKIVSNGETTPEAKAVKYVLSDETWEVSTDRTYHRIVAVKDFVRSDVARQEAEECASKNAVLSADGREPGWDVEPFNLGDMTGDLFVSCGGKPQYLVQVRRIG